MFVSERVSLGVFAGVCVELCVWGECLGVFGVSVCVCVFGSVCVCFFGGVCLEVFGGVSLEVFVYLGLFWGVFGGVCLFGDVWGCLFGGVCLGDVCLGVSLWGCLFRGVCLGVSLCLGVFGHSSDTSEQREKLPKEI